MPSYSISTWGTIPTEGSPIPPEYINYQTQNIAAVFPLNEMQVYQFMSRTYIDWGMNNLYNTIRFVKANELYNSNLLSIWRKAYQLSGPSSDQGPQYIYKSIRYLVESFMFHGAISMIRENDMIFGFNTSYTEYYNENSFLEGNVYSVSNITTPVINTYAEAFENAVYSIRSGNSNVDDFSEQEML